jgi:hypothetical protein
MAITKLHEMWQLINSKLPRDEWIALPKIYSLVEENLQLSPDDFSPSAPNTDEPKWMRNVRNVLQRRKTNGEIAWDKNGKYMIPSSSILVSDDSIVVYKQNEPSHAISEERFRTIQKTREQIGLAGETWVVDYEVNELESNGLYELSKEVKRISVTNIAAGYDVLSYELVGAEKYIEVKTTALSKTEFFLSANELEVAKEYRNRYWIYFVSEIFGIPKLHKIHNPANEVGRSLHSTPISFKVQLTG